MADDERVLALDASNLSRATGGIRYFTDDLSAIVEEKATIAGDNDERMEQARGLER